MSDQPAEQDVVEAPPETAALKASVERMFRWSEYVHVGVGADDVAAEDVPSHGEGDTDPDRFHAWVRLPNPYQHREIREKSLAAKARLVRRMKDPESDAYAILEDELDALREGGDEARNGILDALLQKEWAEDYLAAMSEVNEREDYERIAHDQERLGELEAMPEDERPTDEYDGLARHITAYSEAINDGVEQARIPRREALGQLDNEALIALLRTQRIEADATEVYLHSYGTWEMICGTYHVEKGSTGRPTTRWFDGVNDLSEASSEVVFAIKEAFDDLRRAQQEGATGNS